MSYDSPAAILFDGYGNQVGVIQDGSTYRLQVEAKIASSQLPLPISIAALPLPSGAATDSSLITIDTDIKATQPRDIIDRSGRLLGHVTVDNFPTTQPVSGIVTVNQGTNSWTDDVIDRAGRLLGVIYGSQGQQLKQTATNFNTQVELAVGGTLIDPRSIRALTSSDVITVNAGSGIFTVGGTVTANAGTGNFTVVQSTAANLNATVTGTVTANIGTTNGLALDATLSKLTIAQGSALSSNTQAMVGGSVKSSAPTYSDGYINPLSLTTAGALRVDASGTTISVIPLSASTSTTTSIAASTSTVILLGDNSSRMGATIFNDSSTNIYVKLGADATTSSFTVKMGTGAYYELPFEYTGIITAVWDGALGNARVTELTK